MKYTSLLFFASTIALLDAHPAEACGGFFCSSNQPVDQSAERIVFIDHEDGAVTAAIQIDYTGPSEQFSWVLPVFGQPEVGVSSTVVFDSLQQQTNPQYSLNVTVEGSCAEFGDGDGDGDDDDDSFFSEDVQDAGVFLEDEADSVVSVVSQGAVGPYDWSLISVVVGATDPADVAVEWLETNGYDVTGVGKDLLRPYLTAGMNLIAFKLQKEKDTGAIRPVTLKFDMMNAQGVAMHSPMIPLKLTGVAAQDDMGVMVFHAGASQAVPVNYRSLVLNEAAIDWFNPNSTYNDVVIAAANEAEGHGFVTERAGPMSGLTLWSSENQNVYEFYENVDAEATADDLTERLWRFAAWDGLEEALGEFVAFEGDYTAEQMAECPDCYRYDDSVDISIANPVGFAAAIIDGVLEPAKRTYEEMGSRPYFTRLYTTMSADEMTIDPVFGFNPELEDVSNRHTAEQTIHCNDTVERFEADWTIVLEQGHTIRGTGRTWPFDLDSMPATLDILQQNTVGIASVVGSNRDEINTLTGIEDFAEPEFLPGVCGCNGSTSDLSFLMVAFVGLGFVGRRRRR